MKKLNVTLCLVTCLAVFGALAYAQSTPDGEAPANAGARDQAPVAKGKWWYELEGEREPEAVERTAPSDLTGKVSSTLREGNGCTQDRKVIKNGVGYYQLGYPWNDEARSVMLKGPRGTELTVYDAANWALTDDYAIMEKRDDDPVCVRTFENGSPGQWVGHRGYWIWYSGGDNLDGKVSSLRWGDWRGD